MFQVKNISPHIVEFPYLYCMILGLTGHRKLGTTYSTAEGQKMWALANRFFKQLPKDTIVISGMAIGWDQEAASAALANGLKVKAYVPFLGQESKWPIQTQEWYHHLIEKCIEVVICSPRGYTPQKMQIRNERIVNDCDQVIALWNGEHVGGTYNCVKYADKVGKPVLNLFEYWEEGKVPKADIIQV